MTDLNDRAEQMTMEVTRRTTADGVHLTTQLSRESTAKALDALRATAATIRETAIKPAVDARRERRISRREQRRHEGRVSLRQFQRDSTGARDVFSIEDQRLVRAIEQELRRHGVEFAVETTGRGKDATTYFHFHGHDAAVIAHGIERAQERVDAYMLRQDSKRSVRERIAAAVDRMEHPAGPDARKHLHTYDHGDEDRKAPRR